MTCEFYAVRYDLPRLMDTTTSLLERIAEQTGIQGHPHFANLTEMIEFFRGPYQQLDFIPALNSALGEDLPDLASDGARAALVEMLKKRQIPLPAKPTLPRLLDKLSSVYLEPQCSRPTWIINTPECLSPLAKSFIHPEAPKEQAVAARAELFIHGREIVNCYEEENDPLKQRQKFIEQQKYAQGSENGDRVDDEAMKLDEDYLRAMEWGLPPTGGWGCGIDRLVMLFTGKERIGDVLTFGNLRAVTRGAEKRKESMIDLQPGYKTGTEGGDHA